MQRPWEIFNYFSINIENMGVWNGIYGIHPNDPRNQQIGPTVQPGYSLYIILFPWYSDSRNRKDPDFYMAK